MMQNYKVKIVADSLAPCGKRLTTLVARMPRCILAEWNTHRMFSRNAASSRAIPVEKMIQRIVDDPFIPLVWGKNKPGMQASEELEGEERETAIADWLCARDDAVMHARGLAARFVHKQIVNRLLEPWMFTEVLTSATEWDNFFRQRDDAAAEPHMQVIALNTRLAMGDSEPRLLKAGEWHRPYVDPETEAEVVDGCEGEPMQMIEPSGRIVAGRSFNRDYMQRSMNLVSAARCARVSYLNHEGKRDWRADLGLAEKLIGPGHWSPFEHVAQALAEPERIANFVGWRQFRTLVDHHNFPETSR